MAQKRSTTNSRASTRTVKSLPKKGTISRTSIRKAVKATSRKTK